MTDDKTTDVLSDIVARVADTLEAAAAEYGGDAVELTLLAYRVDAIQTLIAGMVMLMPVLLAPWAFKAMWRVVGWLDGDEIAIAVRVIFGAAYSTLCLILFINAFSQLNQISLWFAAFGYPELMIATKALKAMGAL